MMLFDFFDPLSWPVISRIDPGSDAYADLSMVTVPYAVARDELHHENCVHAEEVEDVPLLDALSRHPGLRWCIECREEAEAGLLNQGVETAAALFDLRCSLSGSLGDAAHWSHRGREEEEVFALSVLDEVDGLEVFTELVTDYFRRERDTIEEIGRNAEEVLALTSAIFAAAQKVRAARSAASLWSLDELMTTDATLCFAVAEGQFEGFGLSDELSELLGALGRSGELAPVCQGFDGEVLSEAMGRFNTARARRRNVVQFRTDGLPFTVEDGQHFELGAAALKTLRGGTEMVVCTRGPLTAYGPTEVRDLPDDPELAARLVETMTVLMRTTSPVDAWESAVALEA